MADLNATHDPARRSWLDSANIAGTDFPVQNLPFGVFKTDGTAPRGGVALGDRIIDLTRLADRLGDTARAATGPTLAPLIEQPPAAMSALRAALSDLYRADGPDRAAAEAALVPMAGAELLLPVKPVAFADFCCSIEHVRRMAATSGRPIAPCADLLPVSYNGRASSVAVSGTPVVRPTGQSEFPPGSGKVAFQPERRLDYELEFGVWLRGGNALGVPITVAAAEAMMFGCSLVNDWSARGIQFFESMLGPHLGKSFMTTVSPWIVTMEALAPFRVTARGRVGDEPSVTAHLLDPADRAAGGIRIAMTADLSTATAVSVRICTTGFETMFWTLAQMVAHQASSGAPLEAGDLLASGTVSGPAEEAKACLAEFNQRGTNPAVLTDGTKRLWLEDGDTLAITATAHAEGHVPIGFGPCTGTIHPAVAWA
ncbi:fumarylacetoacetate hydrolase family protein [Glacieibacterium megasporae]|uniref:fumarylacetoacetate hydrolase family protein n=1 Tax=Glacieibacterium megasporae TaxID=2835787 RepID=UPI001C1DF06D|nr:fumarylacetoacetate hydrolase family protein [Polymorphobacter megasporae]UAJ12567.1 fumarylacetoacetate hydrolase family protein [Polymorphobacter megasporae]